MAIHMGRAGFGSQLTINDVARLTGLSKATVSRAMNGRDRVSAETRARVLDVLDRYGYSPARAATALSTGRTGLVSLMIGENRNPNALSAIEGAVSRAEQAGLRVVVSPTASPERHALTYNEVFRSRLVDGGLLLFPPATDAAALGVLAAQGFPLVAIEPEVDIANVATVYADARHDGLQATRHLLSMGHTRIGLAMDLPGWGEQDRLRQGYAAALRAAGVPLDPALVTKLGWDFDAGRRAIETWWQHRQRPTAALFCCDTAALGAIAAVKQAGGRVPEDFAVVGYDDSELLRWNAPPITSPADRRRGLARVGLELLLELIQDRTAAGRKVRVRTGLSIRASSLRGDTP